MVFVAHDDFDREDLIGKNCLVYTHNYEDYGN